jgi:hypothetical protein
MAEKKKLVGAYLPISLISRLKIFVFEHYTKHGIPKNQSEVIEEAVTEFLDKKEK